MITLGEEAKRRAKSLKEKKLVMADAGEPDRILTVEDAETGESKIVGELTLAQASGDIEKRLLAFQKEFVKVLLDKFDDRIQNPRVALLLREMLDFRRMPLEDSSEAHEQLLVWSDDETDELCTTYFPELDEGVVKDDLLVIRLYVRENQGKFLRDKDPSDTSKGKTLALTGPGSVFEALFARSDVCSKPVPSALHIADYMIALMWQSCNGERAASHINIVKSKERTGLNDETFEAVVFNTYNMPELHEIDFDAIMKNGSPTGENLVF